MSNRSRISLLVRNLRYETSPDRVRKHFEKFGEVRDVYLPLHYHTKRPRGFGFVEFFDEADAEECLHQLHHSVLDGNEISVTVAQQGRKSPETMRFREKKTTSPGKGRFEEGRGHRRSRSPSRSRSASYQRSRRMSGRRSRSASFRRSRYSPRDEGRRSSHPDSDANYEYRSSGRRYNDNNYGGSRLRDSSTPAYESGHSKHRRSRDRHPATDYVERPQHQSSRSQSPSYYSGSPRQRDLRSVSPHGTKEFSDDRPVHDEYNTTTHREEEVNEQHWYHNEGGDADEGSRDASGVSGEPSVPDGDPRATLPAGYEGPSPPNWGKAPPSGNPDIVYSCPTTEKHLPEDQLPVSANRPPLSQPNFDSGAVGKPYRHLIEGNDALRSNAAAVFPYSPQQQDNNHSNDCVDA